MRRKNSYHIYGLATILSWSLAYVYTGLAMQHFTAFGLAFWRYFFASLLLLALAALRRIKPPPRRQWPLFAAAGLLGFSLYMVAFNIGTARVSAATSSIVIATAPVWTALLARLLLREKLRPLQWLAIAVEFAGILLLTLLNGIFSVNTGVLWLLLAALLLSGYNLLQRYLLRTYEALSAAIYSVLAGTLLLAVFAPGSWPQIAGAPPLQGFYLLLLALFPSALGYVLWSQTLAHAPSTSAASNYMFLTPFAATLLGLLVARQVPDRATLIGGGVILAGVFLFHYGGRRGRARRQEQEG